MNNPDSASWPTAVSVMKNYKEDLVYNLSWATQVLCLDLTLFFSNWILLQVHPKNIWTPMKFSDEDEREENVRCQPSLPKV